jgi:Glycosyl transferase family 2
MSGDISALQVLAVCIGVSFLVLAMRGLRSSRIPRFSVWFAIVIGAGAIATGLSPGLLTIPATLLALDHIEGGRLLMVLLVSATVCWMVVISSQRRIERLQTDFDRVLRGLMVDRFLGGRPMPDRAPDICIVIPCLDEAPNLQRVLPRIPAAIGNRTIGILVVDDGSSDGTPDVAQRFGAMLISLPATLGGGHALRIGFAIAAQLGAPIIVTMDGDGQHLPEEIERVVEPITRGDADVVIGSRLLGSSDVSRLRLIGVVFFGMILSLLTGRRISDCASGFRAIRTASLHSLRLSQAQYHTAEFIIEATKQGLRIAEVPITIFARMHGYSKKGRDWIYGYRFARVIISSWFR